MHFQDYELQLASYSAGLETLLKIPIKRTMLQSPASVVRNEVREASAKAAEPFFPLRCHCVTLKRGCLIRGFHLFALSTSILRYLKQPSDGICHFKLSRVNILLIVHSSELCQAAGLQSQYIELLTRSSDYYKFLGQLLKNMEELKVCVGPGGGYLYQKVLFCRKNYK